MYIHDILCITSAIITALYGFGLLFFPDKLFDTYIYRNMLWSDFKTNCIISDTYSYVIVSFIIALGLTLINTALLYITLVYDNIDILKLGTMTVLFIYLILNCVISYIYGIYNKVYSIVSFITIFILLAGWIYYYI